MGPSQICGCPFREPRVFEIAHLYIYIIYLKSTENQMHFMNPKCSGTILDHPRILRPSEGLKSGEEIAAAAKRGMLTWETEIA